MAEDLALYGYVILTAVSTVRMLPYDTKIVSAFRFTAILIGQSHDEKTGSRTCSAFLLGQTWGSPIYQSQYCYEIIHYLRHCGRHPFHR